MTKLLNLEGECLIIDARFADLEVGRLPRLVTRLIDRARLRFSIRNDVDAKRESLNQPIRVRIPQTDD